jgi:hypothetical protein
MPADTTDTHQNARERASAGPFIQLRSFAGLFLSTVCAVLFNYFLIVTIVNPRRQFLGRAFPEIIPNSRALKLELLQQYNAAGKVEMVLLGSSRSMKISPDLLETLTGQRAFNAAVFSGAPNDFLAMYRVMKQRGIAPQTLLIALDQDSVAATEPTPDFDANLALKSALDGSDPRLGTKIWHWVRIYKHTLTPSYVRDSAKSIWIWWRPLPPVHRFQPNGHLDYLAWDLQIQSGTYSRAQKIRQCADDRVQRFDRFNHNSPELESDLEQLLLEAARDKVHVVLWITPMHPAALEEILDAPQASRNFRNAESYLVGLGTRFNVPMHDLTKSESFGGHPETWYDCLHYTETDAARIAEAIFKHGLQF